MDKVVVVVTPIKVCYNVIFNWMVRSVLWKYIVDGAMKILWFFVVGIVTTESKPFFIFEFGKVMNFDCV